MLKWNKPHPEDENNFRSTKLYSLVCTYHACKLIENESYSFRRHVQNDLVTFDEDEIDLSGLQCPHQGTCEINDCTDQWEATIFALHNQAHELIDSDAFEYALDRYAQNNLTLRERENVNDCS